MNSVKMLLQIYWPVWKGQEFGFLGTFLLGFFGSVVAFYKELWRFFVDRAITDKNCLL